MKIDYEAAAEAVGNLWYRTGRPARKEQAREIVDAALPDGDLYQAVSATDPEWTSLAPEKLWVLKVERGDE